MEEAMKQLEEIGMQNIQEYEHKLVGLAIEKLKSIGWKKQFDISLDPKKCKLYRKSSLPKIKDVCTMCSEYCAIKISQKYLKK